VLSVRLWSRPCFSYHYWSPYCHASCSICLNPRSAVCNYFKTKQFPQFYLALIWYEGQGYDRAARFSVTTRASRDSLLFCLRQTRHTRAWRTISISSYDVLGSCDNRIGRRTWGWGVVSGEFMELFAFRQKVKR
jgi:hypothetical protein